ncbi:H-NS histone family protein [Ferrimonas balearica]|nr:H-NS histone family protein [Ferrimonas balearica]
MQRPNLTRSASALLAAYFSKSGSSLTFDMTRAQPTAEARKVLLELIDCRILLEVEEPDGARTYRLTILGQVLARQNHGVVQDDRSFRPASLGFTIQEAVVGSEPAPRLVPKRLRPTSNFIDISALESQRKAAARAALAARARELGYSLDDIAAESARRRSKLPAKYRHPEDPTLTWTGKGRRPRWLHEALDAGMDLEAFSV